MTREGYEQLVRELKECREVLRPQIVRDIEEARAHGDISENSEYEDAKHRQAMLEGRINSLNAAIATAEVITVDSVEDPDTISFGAKVEMVNLETDEEVCYQIVGVHELDVKGGRISYKSPLGRAMLGKSEGDEVRFVAPKGEVCFEVLEIIYE